MAKVTHYVSTLKDSLQKVILVSQISHVPFFGVAKIFIHISADELVFEAVNGPSNVSRQRAIDTSVG